MVYAEENGNPIAENSSSFTPTIAGTYYAEAVYVANENCVSDTRTAFTLTINALPTANAGEDQTICIGESVTLTASGGDFYEWSNDLGNTNEITFFPSETNSYTVTVTDENNCSATDDVQVIVNPLPIVAIVTNDADNTICEGEAITLTASGGNIYIWSNNVLNAQNTVSPTETTTYAVTVIDENNCSATDEVQVTVKDTVSNIVNEIIFNEQENICEINLAFNENGSIAYNGLTTNFIANNINTISVPSGTDIGLSLIHI